MFKQRIVLGALLVSLLLLSSSAYAARDRSEMGARIEEAAQGTITVTGRLSYYDADNVKRPARGVTVWLMDRIDRPFAPWEPLGSGVTDDEGYYTIGPVANDGHRYLYIRYETSGPGITVRDVPGYVYQWFSDEGIRNAPSGVVPFPEQSLQSDDPDVGAMWVYQILDAGRRFVTGDPGPVEAVWEPTTTLYEYVPGDVIHLRGADASSPHAILHMEAHNFMWNAYGGTGLPGGCPAGEHDVGIQASSSATCAWVEGWADFFAVAVTGQSRYVVPIARVDLEPPTWGTAGWTEGDTTAGRVAGALWDLYDDAPDGYDAFTTPFDPMWSAFTSATLSTFAEFWNAFRPPKTLACEAVKAVYQNTIDYDVAPTLLPLPDLTLDEDMVLDRIVDLWAYAADDECQVQDMVYLIDNSPDPRAGVTIEDGRYISVNPEPDWNGATEVRILVGDGIKGVTRTFAVTVRAVNDPPFIDPSIPDQWAPPGTPITVTLAPYGKDVDDPESSLTWTASGADQVSVSGQGSQELIFTPQTTDAMIEVVQLTVQDPHGTSHPSRGTQAVLLVWSAAPNEPPVIEPPVPDQIQSMNRDILLDLTIYGQDAEDSQTALRWYATDLDYCGVAGQGGRVLNFTPDRDFIGSDMVTLIVRDTWGAQATQAVTLTWTSPINQPPTISPVIPHQYAATDIPITIDLGFYGHDVDDPIESLIWYATGMNVATVTGEGSQVLTFTPPAGYEGDEVVALHVRDPGGAEAQQTVVLTWMPNDPPIISPLIPNRSAPRNEPIVFDLAPYAYDPDDPPESLRWYATGMQHSTVLGQGTRTLTFIPESNYTGSDVVTLTVRDPWRNEASQQVVLSWGGQVVFLPVVSK